MPLNNTDHILQNRILAASFLPRFLIPIWGMRVWTLGFDHVVLVSDDITHSIVNSAGNQLGSTVLSCDSHSQGIFVIMRTHAQASIRPISDSRQSGQWSSQDEDKYIDSQL